MGVHVAERLLDRLDSAVRIRGYGVRTAEGYRRWVARYIRFHGLRHPAELDGRHLEAFLVEMARSRAGSLSRGESSDRSQGRQM